MATALHRETVAGGRLLLFLPKWVKWVSIPAASLRRALGCVIWPENSMMVVLFQTTAWQRWVFLSPTSWALRLTPAISCLLRHSQEQQSHPGISLHTTKGANKPRYWEGETYYYGNCVKYEVGDDYDSVWEIEDYPSALILKSDLTNDVWVGPEPGYYGTASAKDISHAIVCYD